MNGANVLHEPGQHVKWVNRNVDPIHLLPTTLLPSQPRYDLTRFLFVFILFVFLHSVLEELLAKPKPASSDSGPGETHGPNSVIAALARMIYAVIRQYERGDLSCCRPSG